MTATMGLSWESLKQEPPSVYLAFLEMSLGFVCFLSLFHALISIVGVLKLKNGQVLSYADNVSLSCKMVSAVFAVISCIMGVVSKYFCQIVMVVHVTKKIIDFIFFSIVQHIVFHPRAFEKALLFLTPNVGGEKKFMCITAKTFFPCKPLYKQFDVIMYDLNFLKFSHLHFQY